MKNMPSILKALAVVVVLVAVIIVGNQVYRNIDGNNLRTVEVKEYQGTDLSALSDFKEQGIDGPQYIDIDSYTLEITGLVNEQKSYTYDQVIDDFKSFKKVSTLYCVDGWDATILWEGVLVRDLIGQTNPLPEAVEVIFHAVDGYTTSLTLEYIMENDIILAYKANEIILPPARGFPFQLVAESKWGYKWIMWVTEIELSDDYIYRGYWESRGFVSPGDLDKPFWDGSYNVYYFW
jgi:DMSO/TMAO reductase YedYZ molybdopterin-dependent catalytic subunit